MSADATPEQIADLANAVAQQAEALAELARSGQLTAGEFDPRANLTTARLLDNAQTLRAWVPNESQAATPRQASAPTRGDFLHQTHYCAQHGQREWNGSHTKAVSR